MVYKWQRSQIENLIACIEQSPCIYNINSKEYLDRKKKAQAFKKIFEELRKKDSSITLEEIKRKWKNLRIQYRQELRDSVKQPKQNGRKSEDIYVPKLWCFEQLAFLKPYSDITEILKHNNLRTPNDYQNDSSNEEAPKKIQKKRNFNLEERVDNVKTLLTARLMEKKDYDWLGKQVVFELNSLKDESLQRETAWKIQQILREAYLNENGSSPEHCSNVYQY